MHLVAVVLIGLIGLTSAAVPCMNATVRWRPSRPHGSAVPILDSSHQSGLTFSTTDDDDDTRKHRREYDLCSKEGTDTHRVCLTDSPLYGGHDDDDDDDDGYRLRTKKWPLRTKKWPLNWRATQFCEERDCCFEGHPVDGERCFFSRCPPFLEQQHVKGLTDPEGVTLTCPESVRKVKGGFHDLLTPLIKKRHPPTPPEPITYDKGDWRTIHFHPKLKRLPGYVNKNTEELGHYGNSICGTDGTDRTFSTHNDDLDVVVVRVAQLVETKQRRRRRHYYAQTISSDDHDDDYYRHKDRDDDDDHRRPIFEVHKKDLRPYGPYVIDFEVEIYVNRSDPYNDHDFADHVTYGWNNQECCTGNCPATTYLQGQDGGSVYYHKLEAGVIAGDWATVNLASCCEDYNNYRFVQDEYGKAALFLWIGVIGNKKGRLEVRSRAYKRMADQNSIFFVCSTTAPAEWETGPPCAEFNRSAIDWPPH